MEVRSGVPAEAVNQSATHTLFVEGSSQEAIDPRALKRLLWETGISVKALGASYHVKSTAQALHPHHPNYYFVIDRDHNDDKTVDEAWANFPDPSKQNLLIWRKRELENYFLDPDYLARSPFLKKNKRDILKERLLWWAGKRIYFDLANQTIATIRENQKANWIKDFNNLDEFKTSDEAIKHLKDCQSLTERVKKVAEDLNFDAVQAVYRGLEAEFLDGSAMPEFGKGTWLDKMRGKPLLASLVNECFEVKDADGKVLTGNEAITLVAEELLQQDIAVQPADFQALRNLIAMRVMT